MDTGSRPIMTYGEPPITGGSQRPKNFALTAPQVHRCTAVVLQDHLNSATTDPSAGPVCCSPCCFTRPLGSLRSPILQGPATPPPTRPHAWPSSPLCPFCRIPAPAQRRLGRQLAQDLASQPAAHGRRSGPDPLSWPADDPDEIYRSEAKSGTSHFHAYATLYVIRNGYRFTVALTPVSRGEPLEAVLKRLLHQAAQSDSLPLAALDRGFYSVG